MVDQLAFRVKPKLPYEPVLPHPESVPDELIHADRILDADDTRAQSVPPVLGLAAEVHLYTAGEIPLVSNLSAVDRHDSANTINELLNAPAAIRHALGSIDPQMLQLVNATASQRENHNGGLDIRKEIQRAHVMLTSLLMRAHLIDRAVADLGRGSQAAPAGADHVLSLEREHIARGLTFLLKDIPAEALEPDAVGFMDNVRKILHTLSRDPKILASYGAPLQGFEGILNRIAAPNSVWIDSEEFNNESELKIRQEEFAATDTGRDLAVFS